LWISRRASKSIGKRGSRVIRCCGTGRRAE